MPRSQVGYVSDKAFTRSSCIRAKISAYQVWDREQARAHGVDEQAYQAYEKANPIFMSAQGIKRYLSKYRSG